MMETSYKQNSKLCDLLKKTNIFHVLWNTISAFIKLVKKPKQIKFIGFMLLYISLTPKY